MANVDVPETVRVWKIGADQANIRSNNNYKNNQGYNLFCITQGKYLTWVKVPVGVNLDFKDQGDNKTHFRLPDKQEREILSGESVALGIGGGEAFLYYKERDVGINLTWSERPIYEWRIFGADSELAKPIPQDTPVALLNDKVQPDPDFLINFDRKVGSDIGWTTSPEFWDQVASFAEKQAADAAKAAIKAYIGV
jgi:hypothetical protein